MAGIVKTTMTAPKQILANVSMQSAVGCVVLQAAGITVGDKTIVKAGTPVTGDLDSLHTPCGAAADVDTGVEGVYTAQMTAIAAEGDVIIIEGVPYTCASAASIPKKEFTGGTIAAQITSLLTMVECADFDVAEVDGEDDKLQFTQKVAATGNVPEVTADQTAAGTLVVGDVATVIAGVTSVVTNNAIGVILHDVDVTDGNANATLLLFGFVNKNRIDATTLAKITSSVKAALNGRITFLTV